jgi:hypothetical protein
MGDEAKKSFTKLGFRIYTPDVPIRIGDVVRLVFDDDKLLSCTPFGAMVVCGVQRSSSGEKVWLVCRVHCSLQVFSEDAHDGQCAAQFERLHFSEAEFRKKLVAYVTGASGVIDNRGRRPW